MKGTAPTACAKVSGKLGAHQVTAWLDGGGIAAKVVCSVKQSVKLCTVVVSSSCAEHSWRGGRSFLDRAVGDVGLVFYAAGQVGATYVCKV